MPNTFRVISAPNQDTTGRVISRSGGDLTYAATIALSVSQEQNLRRIALTGALTINFTVTANANTGAPFIGDKIELILLADGTQRIVTFGTGAVSAGTVTIPASKGAYVSFVFNGTAWQEMCRTIYA